MKRLFAMLLVGLAAGCGDSGDGSHVDVRFVDNLGTPIAGAALVVSDRGQTLDVAMTDSSGEARVSAADGALLTGFVASSTYRVSTLVEGSSVELRATLLPFSRSVPFRVTGLAPGESVEIFDLSGGIQGVASSAGVFEGVALAPVESDGDVTLTAGNSFFGIEKWGATTNVPENGIAVLVLSTDMTGILPTVDVHLTSVSENVWGLARTYWQDAPLYVPATSVVSSTASGTIQMEVVGRDLADSARIHVVQTLDDDEHFSVTQTRAWPLTSVDVDMATPDLAFTNVEYSNDQTPAFDIEISGAADLVGALFFWPNAGSWEFSFRPRGREVRIQLPQVPGSIAGTYTLPLGEPVGAIHILDSPGWEPPPGEVPMRLVDPGVDFEATCVVRRFNSGFPYYCP